MSKEQYALCMASVTTDDMLPVDNAFKPPHEADVFLLPTDQEPIPRDRLLDASFPTGDDCVDGFRSAFAQYVSDGRGDEMLDKLLSELTGKKLEQSTFIADCSRHIAAAGFEEAYCHAC